MMHVSRDILRIPFRRTIALLERKSKKKSFEKLKLIFPWIHTQTVVCFEIKPHKWIG